MSSHGATLTTDKTVEAMGRCGFLDLTETSLSFSDSTYTLTLTSVGASWSYIRSSVMYTVSGNKTCTIAGSPPAADTYYFTIDGTDGTISASTSYPDLFGGVKLLVATVIWDSTQTPKYFLCDERHTAKIDRRMHGYLHYTQGARLISGGTIADYSVMSGAPTDDENTFSIVETQIADEDLIHTLAALSDPAGSADAYTVFYRSGGGWAWDQSEVPFLYGTNYIKYDAAGTLTEPSVAGRYYNTYLLFTHITDSYCNGRFVIIHGQGEFDSLTAAQAERPDLMDITGFPITEAVAFYQLTWVTDSGFSTKGKCCLAIEPKQINVSIISALISPTFGNMAFLDSPALSCDVAASIGEATGTGEDTLFEKTVALLPGWEDNVKGRGFIVRAGGTYTSDDPAKNITYKLYVNGDVVWTSNTDSPPAGRTDETLWEFEAVLLTDGTYSVVTNGSTVYYWGWNCRAGVRYFRPASTDWKIQAAASAGEDAEVTYTAVTIKLTGEFSSTTAKHVLCTDVLIQVA